MFVSFIKQLLVIFAANSVMAVFRMFISEIIINDTIYMVLFWIFSYLSLLVTSGLAVYYQETMLRKKQKKNIH